MNHGQTTWIFVFSILVAVTSTLQDSSIHGNISQDSIYAKKLENQIGNFSLLTPSIPYSLSPSEKLGENLNSSNISNNKFVHTNLSYSRMLSNKSFHISSTENVKKTENDQLLEISSGFVENLLIPLDKSIGNNTIENKTVSKLGNRPTIKTNEGTNNSLINFIQDRYHKNITNSTQDDTPRYLLNELKSGKSNPETNYKSNQNVDSEQLYILTDISDQKKEINVDAASIKNVENYITGTNSKTKSYYNNYKDHIRNESGIGFNTKNNETILHENLSNIEKMNNILSYSPQTPVDSDTRYNSSSGNLKYSKLSATRLESASQNQSIDIKTPDVLQSNVRVHDNTHVSKEATHHGTTNGVLQMYDLDKEEIWNNSDKYLDDGGVVEDVLMVDTVVGSTSVKKNKINIAESVENRYRGETRDDDNVNSRSMLMKHDSGKGLKSHVHENSFVYNLMSNDLKDSNEDVENIDNYFLDVNQKKSEEIGEYLNPAHALRLVNKPLDISNELLVRKEHVITDTFLDENIFPKENPTTPFPATSLFGKSIERKSLMKIVHSISTPRNFHSVNYDLRDKQNNAQTSLSELRKFRRLETINFDRSKFQDVMNINPTVPTVDFYRKRFLSRGSNKFVVDSFAIGVNGLKSSRVSRQSGDFGDVDGPCNSFRESDPKNQVFYSPNFPNNYPNQTDCYRILEAPKGFLLRLDFRDEFSMEQSEGCKFDYLEVRDGAHGFSNEIGKFCGTIFPPMVTSSDRFLWLRFHSDDTIELKGFKAVYEFIPRPQSQPEVEACEIPVGGFEGLINVTDIPEERVKFSIQHSIPLDCMWTIQVKEGWKIQLSFPNFKVAVPNDCATNFVEIFSDRTDLPSRHKRFCGSIADSVTSKASLMFIRFYAEAASINSSFEALYTAFRERGPNQLCEDDEYDCEDNTCIAQELRCNGRNNCRYRWDEDNCKNANKSKMKEENIIIIMVIFSLIVSGMCAAFIFKCVRKIMRDHRLIQEHLRQSRENRIDQIKKKSAGASRDDLKKSTLSLIPPPTGGGKTDFGGGGTGVIMGITDRDTGGTVMVSIGARQSESDSTDSSLVHQRFTATAATTAGTRPGGIADGIDAEHCYVPATGAEIVPILMQKTHLDSSTNTNLHQNSNGEDNDEMNECDVLAPPPEMCDSACQTRESLFSTGMFQHQNSISERSMSPISSHSSIHGYPGHDNFRKVHHCRRSSVMSHDHHRYGWTVDQEPELLNPPQSPTKKHHKGHEIAHKGNHHIPQESPQKAHHFKPHGSPQKTYGMYGEVVPNYGTYRRGDYKSSTEGSIQSHGSPKFSTFGYKDNKNPKYRAEVAIEVDQNKKKDTHHAPAPQQAADKNVVDLTKNTLNKQRPFSVETTKSAPDVIVTH